MKIIQATLLTCAGLLLMAGLLVAGLHLYFVQPYRHEVSLLIAAEPAPPPALYRLAALSESPARLAPYVGSRLSAQYAPGSRLAALYWASVIPVLYSEAEAFKLWVRLAPYPGGQGLRSAAQRYYGQSLATLSELQLAELVVMVRAPSVFAPGSERGQAQARKLLARAAGT